MSIERKSPKILWVPFSPGFPDDDITSVYVENIKKGVIDVLVVETAMSGEVPNREPFDTLGFIRKASRIIPTFLVPKSNKQEEYPRRFDNLVYSGGIHLETAYSAIAEYVCERIIAIFTEHKEVDAVEILVDEFKQKSWPPAMEYSRETGQWYVPLHPSLLK